MIGLYGIVETKANKSNLLCLFANKDNIEAKLYFQGWLTGEIRPSINFTLYKLGEIDYKLQLKGYKIYICNGSKVKDDNKTIDKYDQMKIIQERRKNEVITENLKTLYKNGANISEKLQIAFEGKELK